MADQKSPKSSTSPKKKTKSTTSPERDRKSKEKKHKGDKGESRSPRKEDQEHKHKEEDHPKTDEKGDEGNDQGDGAEKDGEKEKVAKVKVPPISPLSLARKEREEAERKAAGNNEPDNSEKGKGKEKPKGKVRQRAHTIDAPKKRSKIDVSGDEEKGDAKGIKEEKGPEARKKNWARTGGGSMIVRSSGGAAKRDIRKGKTASLMIDKEASIERVLSVAREKKTHKPTAESLFFHDNEDEAFNIFSPRPDVRTLLNDSHMKGLEDEDKEKEKEKKKAEDANKKKKPSLFKRLMMKKE